jgi:predicted ATPase
LPGAHLSGLEKSLAKRWHAPHGDPFPKLRGVTVRGDPGLRGIREMRIEFAFPVTAICGTNGSGKTTALALACLAFDGEEGRAKRSKWSPRRSEFPPYYTFADFFFKGPGDPDVTGVRIEWEYEGAGIPGDRLTITKGSTKWMHYERRPTRPVFYVGERRILPAIEHSVLRHHFRPGQFAVRKPLGPDYCARLAAVMDRPYKSAESMYSGWYAVRTCESGAPYSSFNMGAGEDVLIELFGTLQDCPPGSLIVVEEIELGLHPAAQRRLSRQLMELSKEKQLQIIVSTHSPDFIDSLPAAGRVLLRAADGRHDVFAAPTTRFAMGDLTGRAMAELFVYCEDDTARAITEEALTGDVRGRVNVIPIGSKSELLTQAKAHIRTGLGHPLIVLWDGDVADAEHRQRLEEVRALANARGVRFGSAYLPGASAPEDWLVDTLDCEEGFAALTEELRMPDVTSCPRLVSSLQCCASHDVAYKVHEETGRDEGEAIRVLARAVVRMPSDPLRPIAQAIERALGGDELVQFRPVEGDGRRAVSSDAI